MSQSIAKLFHVCAIGLATTFALYANVSSAQCVYSFGPWPTDTQFVPASPVAGESIRMNLGPLTLLSLVAAVTRQGQDIIVTGEPSFSTGPLPLPPPLHINPVTIGSLPAGNYSVRIQFRQGTTMCPEIVVPLLVGPAPAPTSVPTLSRPWWLAILIAGVLSVGLIGRRRRIT